jgi:hypothetical protein
MECLPTGSEGEALVPLTKTSAEMFNTESLKQFIAKNSWLIKVLVGLVIIIVLIKLGGYLFNTFEPKIHLFKKGGAKTHLLGKGVAKT